MEDDELPLCTPEDRWERFPEGVTKKYAVMKNKDAKRAARVLLSKSEAIKYCKTAKGLSGASFIEVRYAQRKRCEKYCDVKMKCNTFITYWDDMVNGTLNDTVPMDYVLSGRWV